MEGWEEWVYLFVSCWKLRTHIYAKSHVVCMVLDPYFSISQYSLEDVANSTPAISAFREIY